MFLQYTFPLLQQYTFLILQKQTMAVDVLYLTPARGCRVAEKALTLNHNSHALASIPVSDGDPRGPHVKCFAIRIHSQATASWEFTVGSDRQSDVWLPCEADERIKSEFWFCARSDDLESISFMISDHSTVTAKVKDPITVKEKKDRVIDDFTNNTRLLDDPTHLSFGRYFFDVRQPLIQTELEAAEFEKRKREVMTVLPWDTVEVWRNTGEELGQGTFGTVYRLRGIRTGAVAARKTVRGSRLEIESMMVEVEMIKSCKHVRSAHFHSKTYTDIISTGEHHAMYRVFQP